MRLLAISDIHSNYDALEAILQHSAGEYDVLLVVGDLVGFGPAPELVLQRIRRLDPLVVKGNWDDYVSDAKSFDRFIRLVKPTDPRVPAIKPPIPFDELNKNLNWTKERLPEDDIHYLKNLPHTLAINYQSGKSVYAFHASPDNLEAGLPFNLDQEALIKKVDYQAQFVIFGHTHHPYSKEYQGTHYINVSSAGAPLDGIPQASYSIIDLERNQVYQHRIPYPFNKIAQRISDNQVPGGEALLALYEKAIAQG